MRIVQYRAEFEEAVLNLTVKAWAPVFAKTENEVLPFAYDNFYPQGWQARQTADVKNLLDMEPGNIWLAIKDDALLGFIGLRFHPQDQMGEIHIIAVSPDHQRQTIGTRLMNFAEDQFRKAGLSMVMVETGGDSGHYAARQAYESLGFGRWEIARYFKALR